MPEPDPARTWTQGMPLFPACGGEFPSHNNGMALSRCAEQGGVYGAFIGKLLCAVTSAAAAMAMASPADAQRVTRIVAFGDSFADDGNFFQLTGIPAPVPYPTGRFSGGTNFIDTAAE
jgi:hypothetical protein